MKRKERVIKSEQFQRIRKEGRSYADHLLVLCALPNSLDHSRFGFAVGKRVGKAVVRNRIKRLVREAVRLQQPHIAPGWDLVFIARARSHDVSFSQIQETVGRLLRRARLINGRHGERE
ncbi:MAG: ribonuclease P protein component [Anaerolineae bacterium]